ncbi:hypothetical protein [Clostridium brassicae]|uniref:Uncharacterized protein n=1 Tax=Clostridium brassicae TaxID=2999072 RepID=A0ABT4D434_9CLOT|nr:hypothetical protein [Clostridium brassicae]MCY6957037.1 hypothetical protein [Clostridium brassicae]
MLRYIGPFLRMNKLNIDQVKSQLFHLTKESIRDIVLYSKCGITTNLDEINLRTIDNIDINTIDFNSPLLCIYKKSKASLKNKDDKLHWIEDKFKKDIYVSSNAYMTLCLLELIDYYKQFKDMDTNKYYLSNIYTNIAKTQLDFYAAYLRNEEGVFVDKKDCTDPISGKIKFKDKNKSFKFSDQSLLMNAYYKCSTYLDEKNQDSYKNFSKDILTMFLDFKEELYTISFDEQCKLCLNLNIFYTYSGIEEVKSLIIDIFDLLYENYNTNISETKNISDLCLLYLNSILIYNHTNIYKFREIAKNLYNVLKKYYDENSSIFVKHTEEKEIIFSCKEIILYILTNIYENHINDEDNSDIIMHVYTKQLIDSGIILSWPEVPTLDNIERYKNFIEKPENLLDEQYFKMPTIATPNANELPSVFVKSISYDKNKHIFKPSKSTFDSRKNLELFFLIIYLLNNHLK